MKSSSYRRKIWQTAALALVAAAFLGYLKVGLLPGRLKIVAEKRLDAVFQDKVRFERVVYLPFRGISIDGISASKPDGKSVFKAERLVLKVPLLAFLVDQRIVIARASLERPILSFSMPAETGPESAQSAAGPAAPPSGEVAGDEDYRDDSPFERHVEIVGTLFDEGVDALLPENVYLEELVIRNGTLTIRGAGPQNRGPETVNALNLRVTFRKQPLIPVKGSFEFGAPAHTRVVFRGRWDLDQKSHELHAAGTTSKTPEWLKLLLTKRGITIEKLESDFEINLVPKRERFYGFTAATRKTATKLGWSGRRLEGTTAFRIAGTWDTAARKTAFTNGTLTLAGASLKGLPPPVGGLDSVYGAFDFDANMLRFSGLRALWNGAAILLTGRFALASPADWRIEAAMKPPSLAFLKPLFPAASRLDLSKFRGDFDIRAAFEANSERPDEMRKEIRLGFSDASWQVPVLLTEVTEGRGAIRLADDEVRLEGISFLSGKNRIEVAGAIGLIPAIPSSVTVKGAGVSAKSRFILQKTRADIDELDIAWGKTRGRFHGTLGTSTPNPLELEGDATIDLGGLAARFGPKIPALGGLKPNGQAKIHSRVRSELGSQNGPAWNLTAEVPALKLLDSAKLENVVFDMSSDGLRTTVTYGKANLYGGELRFTGEAGGGARPSFGVQLTAMDVDLSQTPRDFESLDKKFSGTLNMEIAMSGLVGQKESIAGGGQFDVRHGRLFTTPLFKRLKNLVFVTIEGMDNVTFGQAQGSFKIGAGRVHTEDTVLSSPQIDIRLKGDILLDQSLNLVLRSRFTPELINESYEIGGLAPLIMNYAEDKINVYTVTGTLSKPVYTEQKAAMTQ